MRRTSMMIRLAGPGFMLLLGALLLPTDAPAQTRSTGSIPVSLPGGEGATLPVERHRGYPAVPAAALVPLGWELSERERQIVLLHRTGIRLEFTEGTPFLRWDGELLQMVHSPYRIGGRSYLPVQVVVDLLPGLLPSAYRFDTERGLLLVEGSIAPPVSGRATEPPAPAAPSPGRAPRIVVIDPGHGGDDPGAIGPGGSREKEIALAVGLALARELAGDPDIEVRLTRDRDAAVPLWERGARATQWKGERPGIFFSIHANALDDRAAVRGFETYFLSEARTEHEARVAAAENAPFRQETGTGAPPAADPLLAAILRDLRTFDHQHWSALLAEMVQREMGAFHPGADRGVKQGPFAVLTNAMMPSVLVEIGFVTNREEERLMMRPEFHRDTARALAKAAREFFARYPAGGPG